MLCITLLFALPFIPFILHNLAKSLVDWVDFGTWTQKAAIVGLFKNSHVVHVCM